MQYHSNGPRLPAINQIIDGFRVVETLGQGGMGAVFKVEKQGCLYALKVVLNPSREDLVRFEREALSLAAFRHPNIVAVHSFQKNSPFPYIIFDYIEGGDLSDRLKDHECWSLGDSLKTLRPLASALDQIHSQGIVHRDLKPANILIRNSDQEPMLTDFGIAKNQDMETLTRTGEIVGTIAYMAPEQFQGEQVTPQTDQWALAVILYRLMSGNEAPFPGTTAIETAQFVLLKDHTPLSKYAPSVPKPLEIVFQKAFAKESSERFESCQEFIAQCDRVLNNDSEIERQYLAQRSPLKRMLWLLLGVLVLLGSLVWFAYDQEKTWNKSKTKELTQLTMEFKSQKDKLPGHFLDHISSTEPSLPCCIDFSQLTLKLENLSTALGKADPSSAIFRESKKLRRQLEKIKSQLPPSQAIHRSSQVDSFPGRGSNTSDRALIRAIDLFRQKQFLKAHQEFTELSDRKPVWIKELRYARALTALKVGKIDEAMILLNGLPEFPKRSGLVKALRYKVYLEWSVGQLFNPSRPFSSSVNALETVLKQNFESEERASKQWSSVFQRRFDKIVQTQPMRADALFVNQRKLSYQFPRLQNLKLSKNALSACLKGAEQAKNLGRMLMFARQLRRLDPKALIPKKTLFAFDEKGLFDFYLLTDKFEEMFVRGQSRSIDMFNVVLEAQRQGVYLELLEDHDRRIDLSQGKSIKKLLSTARFDPFLIYWRAEFSSSWDLAEKAQQLNDLEYVIKHPKIPKFLLALVLTTRVSKQKIAAESMNSAVPKSELQQCLVDIERVKKLPHPRPEIAYMLTYELMAQGLKTKEEIEPIFSEIQELTQTYLTLLNKRRRLSRSRQTSLARPPGVPLARDSEVIFDAHEAYFNEYLGTLYYRQEKYKEALACYMNYCNFGVNSEAFQRMFDCIERANPPDKKYLAALIRALTRTVARQDRSETQQEVYRRLLARARQRATK